MNERKIAVIGGGAAGMLAAGYAAKLGARVTLFERNTLLGKKLGITGKGRCNVTNNCTPEEFIKNITANGKFLYSAINRFSPADTMAFFEELGVPLKTERGRRVFPVSDKAADISDALVRTMKTYGVKVLFGVRVEGITEADGCVTVKTPKGEAVYRSVIVATGGVSYPGTGSTGDGHRMLRKIGVGITPLKPSLVPIVTEEDCSPLTGLTLKNVTLTVYHGDDVVYTELGEMLLTHFGVSGPLVLSASSNMQKHPVDLIISDIKMPEMNGIEAAQFLLTENLARPLLLTTFDEEDFIIQALKLGVGGYILKNSPPERRDASPPPGHIRHQHQRQVR